MYVMSCEDSSFGDMHYAARLIAREVEELGGTWGAWVYNGEMSVADYNDGESSVHYFEMDISNDIDILALRNEVSLTIRGQYECGHLHDCCGCWFLSTISIVKQWPNEPPHAGSRCRYIVRLSLGRNV